MGQSRRILDHQDNYIILVSSFLNGIDPSPINWYPSFNGFARSCAVSEAKAALAVRDAHSIYLLKWKIVSAHKEVKLQKGSEHLQLLRTIKYGNYLGKGQVIKESESEK